MDGECEGLCQWEPAITLLFVEHWDWEPAEQETDRQAQRLSLGPLSLLPPTRPRHLLAQVSTILVSSWAEGPH